MPNTLTLCGDACTEKLLTLEDLRAFAETNGAIDTATWDSNRAGRGVMIDVLLAAAQATPAARYLTLHAARDDFHASVPLDAVRGQACLVFERDGQPLAADCGGPFRFLIRNYAACKTAEVDDCANVKFVDRLELSAEPGQDNRPQDERAHAELHRRQA